eukprot:6696721-Prymnesium_polylepis.1
MVRPRLYTLSNWFPSLISGYTLSKYAFQLVSISNLHRTSQTMAPCMAYFPPRVCDAMHGAPCPRMLGDDAKTVSARHHVRMS